MIFHSWVFVAFFAVTYAAYVALQKRLRAQNAMLLVASWVFYGWWDWRFLSLLIGSTAVDFTVARLIDRAEEPTKRRRLILVSVVMNLVVLGFFKYFNFFGDSAARLLETLGLHASWTTLHIVLPVGISFYTFQALSYTIDVYRKELKATDSFVDFALYITFFPQLVAGPIERATHLLPQVQRPRTIGLAQLDAGLWLILWGYCKKLVFADNVAPIADRVFTNVGGTPGLELVVGVLAFTLQIYCDFSAYSDIARGLAKWMGFDLMLNFRLPYLALSPSDFWLRWHVSLSQWLRDYLYIPLGGNRGSAWKTNRNLALTMLLGGLWHGAAWNYVLWGAFHGVILVVYRLLGLTPEREPRPSTAFGWLRRFTFWAVMSVLTVLGWVLFRASSAADIALYFSRLSLATGPNTLAAATTVAFVALPLALVQLLQHFTRDLLFLAKLPTPARALVYGLVAVALVLFGARTSTEFIYFQF